VAERQVPVPSYLGLSYLQALSNLFENRLPFSFVVNESLSGERGIILAQSPGEGEYLGTGSLQLGMRAPTVERGTKFILIDATLPVYPVFVKLEIQVEEPNGSQHTLYSFYTKGGRISLPAIIKENSSVNLSVFDKLVQRLVF
jgi:hypothetical protein